MTHALKIATSKTMKNTALLIILITLSACSSIIKGDTQMVSIDTPNCPMAKCILENDEGYYNIPETPGSIMLERSNSRLMIDCRQKGNEDIRQTAYVESGIEGMFFGNLIAGGIIGLGVDAANGSAYDYPKRIEHPLECS